MICELRYVRFHSLENQNNNNKLVEIENRKKMKKSL